MCKQTRHDDSLDPSNRPDWIHALLYGEELYAAHEAGSRHTADLDRIGIFTTEEADAVSARHFPVGAPVRPCPVSVDWGDQMAMEADQAVVAAVHGLASLSGLSQSPDPVVRRRANEGFALAQREFRPAKQPPDLVEHVVFRWGRNIDSLLGRWRKAIQPATASLVMSRAWTPIGLLMTCAVAWALANGHLAMAGLILAVRQILTVRLGGWANLPFEHAARRLDRDIVNRCVATHTADAVMLVGVAIAGYQTQSILVLLVALVSLVAMLTGTLLRLAALQVGVQISRLYLERVMRVWPAILALLGAFVVGSSWVVLAVSASGPLVYGVGEICRSLIRIRHDLRGKDRVLVFTTSDLRADGSHTVEARERFIA